MKKTNVKFSSNMTKDKEYQLPCYNCNNETFHKVLSSEHKNESDEYTQIWYEYEIVMCLGCKEITFRYNYLFSKDEDFNSEGEPFLRDHVRLFPNRILGRRQLRDSELLPKDILKIYEETYVALTNNAPILTGVGIRALLEAICKEKKAIGKDLEKRIDNLVILKVLTEEGAEILHSTRLMGNKAAHELIPASGEDIDVAMSLLEHLLLGVYILPKKAKSLPKRKVVVKKI